MQIESMTSPALTPSLSIFPLDPTVHQDTRWCPDCGGPQTFVEVFEVESGRYGFCFGCGQEKFVPFSRTTGER